MVVRLSTFPSVEVRIVCEACGRARRYRLARLAYRFGPEAEMTAVMEAIVVGCRQRTPASGGCGAKLIDPAAEAARRPPIVPLSRRNPRRAYERDGSEIEPPTIASILPPNGTGQVSARCQRNGCGHAAVVDVTGLPAETYVPDVGLRLRCGKCGVRGSSHITGVVYRDRGPSRQW